VEMENMFVVQPAEALWFGYSWQEKGKLLQDGFRYASDNNSDWLDIEGIRNFIAPFEKLFEIGKLES
jgi:UDP-N-acetylglucosamine 4,6-dehydratase